MIETASTGSRGTTLRYWFSLLLVLLTMQVASLYLMGRDPICSCGYVKLFESATNIEGNSQHIADWYAPSHIIHGFLFYLVGWILMRRASFGARLNLALAIEIAWELLENSPLVIERYRTATMAITYHGDSILNSAMDSLFMVLGFSIASRLPVWLTVVTAIALELLAAWAIRDNLTLNVLMLIWPVEAIKEWQGAL